MLLEKIRSSSEVRQLYTFAPFPNHAYSNELLERIIQEQQDFFAKFMKPGMKILDAGCGTGNYVAAFAKTFPQTQFMGVDFTEASLEKAKAGFGSYPNLSFAWHDLMQLYPTPEPFDVITSIGVIHHLENQVTGLKNLAAILKDDGVLILLLYGLYGRFELELARHVVLNLTSGLNNWDERFEVLYKIKEDRRLTHFYRNKYWFLPEWLKKGARYILYGSTKGQYKGAPSAEADSFFHPIVNVYTINSIVSLLAEAGLEVIEFNEKHPGSFHVPPKLFDDPQLETLFRKLGAREQWVIAESLLKPNNYYFAARKMRSGL